MLFEHVFYLKIRTCLHDDAWKNVVARNEHFDFAFVDVDVVSGSDIFDVRFASRHHFVQRDKSGKNPEKSLTYEGTGILWGK